MKRKRERGKPFQNISPLALSPSFLILRSLGSVAQSHFPNVLYSCRRLDTKKVPGRHVGRRPVGYSHIQSSFQRGHSKRKSACRDRHPTAYNTLPADPLHDFPLKKSPFFIPPCRIKIQSYLKKYLKDCGVFCYSLFFARGCSSVGRAVRSQRTGQGFKSPHLHQRNQGVTAKSCNPFFLLLHPVTTFM